MEYRALYCFNIGNEVAIPHSESRSYTPPELIRDMRRDLAPLGRFFIRPGSEDRVLLPSDYPLQLLPEGSNCLNVKQIRKNGMPYRLEMYGPEPSLVRQLRKDLADTIIPLNTSETPLEKLRCFYDRSLGWRFLREYYPNLAPQTIQSPEELLRFTREHEAIVVKHPYSSSGRGIFRFFKGDICKENFRQKFSYPLVVEPYYNVKSNWGAEYHIDRFGQVHYLGLSHFLVKGFRYLYNRLLPQNELETMLLKEVSASQWEKAKLCHKAFLTKEVAPYYRGNLGIDLFVFDQNLHPCSEINVRTTMGHLALRLFSDLSLRTCSVYRFGIRDLSRNSKDFEIYTADPEEFFTTSRHRQLALTPIGADTRFVAYLSYENSPLE